MKWLHNKEEFVKTLHYVILEFTSHWEEGYDRGDPGRSVPHVDYIYFTDKSEWEKEISKRTIEGDKKFVAIVANPVSITTNVSVSIK